MSKKKPAPEPTPAPKQQVVPSRPVGSYALPAALHTKAHAFLEQVASIGGDAERSLLNEDFQELMMSAIKEHKVAPDVFTNVLEVMWDHMRKGTGGYEQVRLH